MTDATRQPAIPSAVRSLEVNGPFNLRKTAGPVDWGRGRWPNVHWSGDRLHWVGRRGESVVWRSVRQAGPTTLEIEGTAEPSLDLAWLADVLGVRQTVPAFEDAVARLDNVVQAQRLFGDPDYLLQVVVRDLPAYQRLYDERLTRLPGVLRMTSTLVMKHVVTNRPLTSAME